VTSKPERRQPVETPEEQKKLYKAASESEEHGEWFHPETVLLTGFMAFLVFCVVFGLALIVGPRELEPQASLITHPIPSEEWWFWWYSAVIALLPPIVAQIFVVAFPLLLFVGLLLLPLVDRGPNRGVRNRPLWAIVVVGCFVALLALSDLRVRSPWTGWPDPNPPPVPAGMVLAEEVEMGRQLFARYGCNSCHSVAGSGREVGPDLARIEHRLSQSELRNYILAPPEDVPMPSYRGRMTEAELDRVVQFVLAAQTFPRE
jgi:ubiquinol-cytochrome c reductase cytochrome b subunit